VYRSLYRELVNGAIKRTHSELEAKAACRGGAEDRAQASDLRIR